jgi:L-seryl-tRNA(Ser) seleniumtransferase
MKQPLRAIPAVGKILDALGETSLPRPLVVAVVRQKMAALRSAREIPGFDDVVAAVRSELAAWRDSRIRPVINGTGILIHTNLGRAPLAPEVIETLCAVGANYNNLEYDVSAGERGTRAAYLEHNLALLCGAEAATAVNNCAAALVLILKHFASEGRPEVIISRSELIQIGGGFRIPDILEASGARLREVGTTNKTSLADYAKAITKQTALILKVHHSNFFMGGFVEAPATEKIGALARQKRIPFVEDLGSGAVVATDEIADVEREPTPAEVLERGVDLVCFSGDKLLGGPQAGIIAGKRKQVAALKREPFFRALRCDKLILSALQTTVDLYLTQAEPEPKGTTRGKASSATPALAMLGTPLEELRARAEKILAGLSGLSLKASIGTGQGEIGGGTLPRSRFSSVTVDLWPDALTLSEFASRLRRAEPPVIGYVSANRFKLDLRTVFARQDDEVIRAIRAALA